MEKRLSETYTITIINQKGEVGKTSTCTPMATLLGLAGYRSLVVDDSDYIILRGTFEILEKRLAIQIPTTAYEHPYISTILDATAKPEATAPYENKPHMSHDKMIERLNSDQTIRNKIQACLLTVGGPFRNIRYCIEDDRSSNKYSFVQISVLKQKREVKY